MWASSPNNGSNQANKWKGRRPRLVCSGENLANDVGLEDAINAGSSVEYVGPYTPLVSGFNYEKLGVAPRPVSKYRPPLVD